MARAFTELMTLLSNGTLRVIGAKLVFSPPKAFFSNIEEWFQTMTPPVANNTSDAGITH
jgi:hypothetical protein